jgi:hypothetical protein
MDGVLFFGLYLKNRLKSSARQKAWDAGNFGSCNFGNSSITHDRIFLLKETDRKMIINYDRE